MKKSIGFFIMAVVMITFDVLYNEEQQLIEPKDTMVIHVDRADVELSDIEKEDGPIIN